MLIDPSQNLLSIKVSILRSIEIFFTDYNVYVPLQKLNVSEMYKFKTENSNFVL